MIKILIRCLALFKKKDLSDFLKEQSFRDSIIGSERRPLPNQDKTRSDAAKIVNYAKSDDYAVYADELWETVNTYIRLLGNPALTDAESNFYRGSLTATIDCLRISFKASHFISEVQKDNKPPKFGEIRPPLGVYKGSN